MPKVHVRPRGANAPDPSHPPLDLGDRAAFERWIARVETVADDGFAAGEDQLLPLAQRRLGRVVARGIVADARTALAALLGAAKRGRPATPAERAVDGALLAFEADPTAENEGALREALRAGGASPDAIDRTVNDARTTPTP